MAPLEGRGDTASSCDVRPVTSPLQDGFTAALLVYVLVSGFVGVPETILMKCLSYMMSPTQSCQLWLGKL